MFVLLILLFGTTCAQTNSIIIESNFDSGNLRSANKIGPGEYNIELEPYNDAAVWFHFRIINAKDSTVTFHLLNEESGENIWHWLEPAISADWKNWDNIFNHSYNNQAYTFTHTFMHDTTYVCTHPAFNTQMMQDYLDEIETHPKVVNRNVITTSVQGRPIDMVTLTDPTYPDSLKLGVWLISRQHASELAGWYVLQGLMNWLLSTDPHATDVMKHMIFNIIPMMNPDGVYLGKYRTTSINIDLNRQWDNANPVTEPSVYAVTQLIEDWVNAGKDFSYFTDFHATKNGTTCFIYHASQSLVPGFISQTFYNNQQTFLNLIDNNCPLINVNYSSSISSSSATTVSRQYMISRYQQYNDNFISLLYEGVNVNVSYGPYIGQTMTIDLEHLTGEGFGESLYSYYVEPILANQDNITTPVYYNLVKAFPNPFNSVITFEFSIHRPSIVKLSIYNSPGQLITTFVNENIISGVHLIQWDAGDLSSGLYYYRLTTDQYSKTGKIVLLK